MRSGEAFTDAHRDHQNAVGRREAVAVLPKAWTELLREAHELIVETLAEKTEALSGYRPEAHEVEAFLRSLTTSKRAEPSPAKIGTTTKAAAAAVVSGPPTSSADKSVTYTLFGQARASANASRALVEILSELARRDSTLLPDLAAAVRTKRMAHVAQSPQEINPGNPSIARAHPIAPGWMVGLNISNKTKMAIIQAACEIWQIRIPQDLQISMPNT